MGRHEKQKKKRMLFSAPVEKPKKVDVSFVTHKGKKVKFKAPKRVPKKVGVSFVKKEKR